MISMPPDEESVPAVHESEDEPLQKPGGFFVSLPQYNLLKQCAPVPFSILLVSLISTLCFVRVRFPLSSEQHIPRLHSLLHCRGVLRRLGKTWICLSRHPWCHARFLPDVFPTLC